jgi:hypothetical protein
MKVNLTPYEYDKLSEEAEIASKPLNLPIINMM